MASQLDDSDVIYWLDRFIVQVTAVGVAHHRGNTIHARVVTRFICHLPCFPTLFPLIRAETKCKARCDCCYGTQSQHGGTEYPGIKFRLTPGL